MKAGFLNSDEEFATKTLKYELHNFTVRSQFVETTVKY